MNGQRFDEPPPGKRSLMLEIVLAVEFFVLAWLLIRGELEDEDAAVRALELRKRENTAPVSHDINAVPVTVPLTSPSVQVHQWPRDAALNSEREAVRAGQIVPWDAAWIEQNVIFKKSLDGYDTAGASPIELSAERLASVFVNES